MKKTKDFNDFLLDMLLEDKKKKGHGVTELPFVISPGLKSLLSSLNHPIATKLLQADEEREDKKVTFVDLDKMDNSKFTLVNSNKAFDNIVDMYGDKVSDLNKLSASQELDKLSVTNLIMTNDYWIKNRATVKIGSFVGKVFPGEYKQSGNPGADVESFVQAVIAKRTEIKDRKEGKGRFKLVNGQDIVKYYNESIFDITDELDNKIAGEHLTSCMSEDSCASYVDFYAQNEDVSMLILFSDIDGREDKIVGRAIVWKLGMPTGRTFMDRIYYRYEADMAMFKQHAERKGWLYKNAQDMNEFTKIVDPKDNTTKVRDLTTTATFKKTRYYPYMDTMKWFNIEKDYLTNDEDIVHSGYEYYKLEDIHGGYDEGGEGQIYVEFYEDSFDEEDLVYCQLGDEYRKHDDAYYVESLDQYATKDYIDDNLVWSDYNQDYLDKDMATYSDHHQDYFKDEEVIILSSGADEPDMDDVREIDDVRHDDDVEDDTVIMYIDKDKMSHFFSEKDYGEYFVKVMLGEDAWNQGWKHKIWDKDKLFKHGDHWYYEYDSKMKDRITGQTRLWD